MGFQPLQSPWWRQGDLEEVAPNTVLPFPLQELKDFLKITHHDYDPELSRALLEATRFVQFEIGRAITTWSLKLHLDAFPCVIELPYPPLQGTVTAITYIDTDGASQTLSSSLYQVHAMPNQVGIIPSYGNSWPSTRGPRFSAVQVAYLAGATSETTVPVDVKFAIKWKVRLMREDQLTGTVGRELRDGYDRIINSLRRVA